MVLGTTSGAGKSWLTTALCRHYARQGLKVAPFKAQNMSNNARVVVGPDGALGEIGSAQYFQALAARAMPEVRMNPLLLKPEADTRSQVVLMGQVSAELTALPWRGRSQLVWPQIAAALDALRAENDVVVIEGAGSPAETNLHASDIVNMRVARHAGARCLLVTDIDRGGAFAHLYGTWALLPEDERALIHGFVLNKFRGDASLLAPAPQHLQERTGVPTVATIPMQWHHGLPEEDGVFDMTPTLGTGVSSLPPEGADSPRGGPSANPNDQKVSFTVPSGNFGNICAGHVARMMGLPIDKLVVATNENDVLDEFFRTGVYRVRGSADTHETSSPSMDISKASNFERFVFDLLGRNGQRTKALFSAALQTYGRFDLSAEPLFADAAGKYGFESGKSTHADRLATIRDTYSRFGVTIDTHTADGVKVAREHRGDGSVPMIVLETALPIKFAETIQEALGHAPERPDRFAGIEALPKRVQVMPADVELVKAYIERHCQ